MIIKTYELNAQKVVSETVDGESIIINLEKGNYYSLNQIGSEIWNFAITKNSNDSICEYISKRYEIDLETCRQSVDAFLNSLVDEGLLVESSEKSSVTIPEWTGAKETYITPAFERYDDMQEMLLADPIHDVNESGWPILKKDSV